MRVTRGEAAIQAYVDSVIERDSYKPREGEEQTPARDSKLKIANQRTKLCYSKLNGGQLGEARRRLSIPTNMRLLDSLVNDREMADGNTQEG